MAKKQSADTYDECPRCDRQIVPGQRSAVIIIGRVHVECHEAIVAEVYAQHEQAIRDGQHSTTVTKVCESCGEWFEGGYYHTLDGKWICKACSAKAGLVKCEWCAKPLDPGYSVTPNGAWVCKVCRPAQVPAAVQDVAA